VLFAVVVAPALAVGLGLRRHLLEHNLSTDAIQSYKYQMAVEAFSLKREEILFSAFAGCDAARHDCSAIRDLWVNRLNQPTEELGEKADAHWRALVALVAFLSKR
jgi:hypothetical protein